MSYTTRPSRAARGQLLIALVIVSWSLIFTLAAVVSAHTPEVTSSCAQGLQVKLRAYDRDTKVTITVDGDTTNALAFTFTGDFDYTYSLRPSYEAHSYVVTIDNSGTRYDRRIEGRQDACNAYPTTTEVLPPAGPTTTGYPATPPCLYPGQGAYDFNDPQCNDVRAEILTPAVEEAPVATPTPLTPAFTG